MRLLNLLAFVVLVSCSQGQEVVSEIANTPAAEPVKTDAPLTQGVSHIGFAVSDLDASTAFFTDILNWNEVGGDPSYPSRFVSDGKIFVTLWQTASEAETIAFNRKTNVGLHHFAITVADLETFDALYETLLQQSDVKIEFAPEFLGEGPTTHMMIREPSGLRLEFIVPGGKRRATP